MCKSPMTAGIKDGQQVNSSPSLEEQPIKSEKEGNVNRDWRLSNIHWVLLLVPMF